MAEQPTVLSPEEALRRLADAGIHVARSAFAATLDDVPAAFDQVQSQRVVLKAAGLLHKTDQGGVVLNVTSADQAKEAAAAMVKQIGNDVLPFMVQAQGDGVEMLVGLQRVPDAGTIIVIGLGGVQTEIHKDTVRAFIPVTRDEVRTSLEKLRSWPLLNGFRGEQPRDVDALVDLVVRLADMAARHGDIDELDLNPVLVGAEGRGCLVVDVRIVTADEPPARARRTPERLNRMLRPQHVAVVGVSDDERKFGARLFRDLIAHNFPGRLDPINPSGGTVRGYNRYRQLTDLDSAPDLVCIAVPSSAILDVARQAVAINAGGVIVHSSDFAEVGEEGRALQDELARILAEGGVPLAGPNNMGIVAPHEQLAASISGGLSKIELVPGDVALLTSSGALGSCVATRLMDEGIGLSYWTHVGNEADLVMADYLEWLATDPTTKAVGLLIEDIKDGAHFIDAGRALAAAGKPMFAYNLVRSERAREAALSHTGAMMGSFEVREDLIREAGMVSVPTLRVLEDALLLASSTGIPDGDRLAVLTFSGGSCTIISDEADRWGIKLPELSESTRARLVEHLPSFAAVRNPVDVSYQMVGHPDAFRSSLLALLEGNDFDAALVQFTTNADPHAVDAAKVVLEVRDAVNVPVYVSRFGGEQLAPDAIQVYKGHGVPLLDAPDRATQAIGALVQARRAIDRNS